MRRLARTRVERQAAAMMQTSRGELRLTLKRPAAVPAA